MATHATTLTQLAQVRADNRALLNLVSAQFRNLGRQERCSE